MVPRECNGADGEGADDELCWLRCSGGWPRHLAFRRSLSWGLQGGGGGGVLVKEPVVLFREAAAVPSYLSCSC